MKYRILKFHISLFLLFFWSIQFSVADALTPGAAQLVDLETQWNAISKRNNGKLKLEHFEIPLDYIDKDISSRIPADIRDSLIFVKNGISYIRWIVNPEDTTYYKQVEEFLKKHSLDSSRYRYFDGYQTASRSYIVRDPKSGKPFSLKVSTDHTGGAWTNKAQTFEDARLARAMTDHVIAVNEAIPFRNVVLMDEPAAFGLAEIDHGMIVRTLNEIQQAEAKHTYVPAFSLIHEKLGTVLAAANGSSNPAEFWDLHLNRPLARAMAELTARTGMFYDSAHAQNFLVELDANKRPTGRIVFRDLGDSLLNEEIAMATGNTKLVELWQKTGHLKKVVGFQMALLKGSVQPSWLDDQAFAKWGANFAHEYSQEITRITGIEDTFAGKTLKPLTGGAVRVTGFGGSFKLSDPKWKVYFAKLHEFANKKPLSQSTFTKATKLFTGSTNKADGCKAILSSIAQSTQP